MPPFAGYRIDPDTGLKVWRLGGSAAEMGKQLPHPDGNDNITILHAQHFYSRTSPVNRDETYVLGSAGQNHAYAALWRLQDKQLVAWVPSPFPEAHIQQRQLLWDRKAANVYWFTQGNQLIRASIDFKTYRVRTEIWDTFPNFAYITFGYGEGNFSDDGKRLVLTGEAKDGSGIYFQPYEVASKQHLPRRFMGKDEETFDWASIDPSGEYIVYAMRQPEEKTLTVPFTQAANAKPRELLDDIKHSDLILDPDGKPWMVYGNWQGLFAVSLTDTSSKQVWPEPKARKKEGSPTNDANGHVARIAAKPGWVLLSRHRNGGLYLVDITGHNEPVYVGNSRQGHGPPEATNKQKARRWGVTADGEVTMYKREARAAASPSGRYLFFVSDYHAYATRHGGYDPEPEPSKAFLNMIERQPEP